MMGMTEIMVRRFDPAGVCRLIQDERATIHVNRPHHGERSAGVRGRYVAFDLSSMRQIMIGGAAATPALIVRTSGKKPLKCEVMARLRADPKQSPVATSSRRKSTVIYANDEDRWQHQSVAGWPIYGAEVRVVDNSMCDVRRDLSAVGEVVVRGDIVMRRLLPQARKPQPP